MSLHDGILQSKAISTIYKPNIKVNNQFLDMNLMTQGKWAEIMIKNEEGKVMITEKIENEVSVTRRFNIKEFRSWQLLPGGAHGRTNLYKRL